MNFWQAENTDSYLKNLGRAVSQLGNALMGRYRGITISAYTGYKAHMCRTTGSSCQWVRFETAINSVFGSSHCYRAAVSEGLL